MDERSPLLTIGELARQVGLRTSALRYYEQQGLLKPAGRTPAGYRLYAPEAEERVRFIQRARRLGFSLADIRALLAGGLDQGSVLDITEKRYLILESQLTELLIQRHELGLFLDELTRTAGGIDDRVAVFDRLLDRVCVGPAQPSSADAILAWLMAHTGCTLTSLEESTLLDRLRGRHIHLWKEEDGYRILVVGHDPDVGVALQELARLEAECHAHSAPHLERTPEGYLLTARGENAFIFARLFLALEGDAG